MLCLCILEGKRKIDDVVCIKLCNDYFNMQKIKKYIVLVDLRFLLSVFISVCMGQLFLMMMLLWSD